MALTVQVDNLVQNYRSFAKRTPVAAVVKADAYGLGLKNIVLPLLEQGVQAFFVAYPAEGVVLRTLDRQIKIYVLNGFGTDNIEQFKECNLIPVCNTAKQVALLPSDWPFALQIETGMNRSGLSNTQPDRQPDLLMSHLACAETLDHPLNTIQLKNFHQAAQHFRAKQLSLAASYGSLSNDYIFDFCRIGIGLYGGISKDIMPEQRPVVQWDVPVLETRNLTVGETVGYDATWQAPRPSKIATLGVGYADGYPRALSNKGHVFCNGIRCPVVGRVSMDLVTIDITEVSGDVTAATLYGDQYTVVDAAEAAGTNSYEILTNLNNVRRKD